MTTGGARARVVSGRAQGYDPGMRGRRLSPIVWVLLAAAVARMAVFVAVGPYEWLAGGDAGWYVDQAWMFARGTLPYPFRTVGPLYPSMLALLWHAWPEYPRPEDVLHIPLAYLTIVRVVQVLVGVGLVWLTYRLALRVGASRPGATVAAAGVALTPAFVFEPYLLHTETIAITLFVASVLLAVEAADRASAPRAAAAGVLAALGGMTRLFLLPWPLLLAGGLALWPGGARGPKLAGAALLAAALLYTPWLAWLHRGTGLWLPEGFAFHLLVGATGEGVPPDRGAFDALVARGTSGGRGYLSEASGTIAGNVAGWATRRLRNVGSALAQPHGTADLPGASVKRTLAEARAGGAAGSLVRLGARPDVWVRLLAYVGHGLMLVGAVVGLRQAWSQPRWLVVHASVLFVLGVHGLLTASPRYLMPAHPFLWVLAGQGLASVRTRRTTGQSS